MSIPWQSKLRTVRWAGSTLAAKELGVHRSHLDRVLRGERSSKSLMRRWRAWLAGHPEFSTSRPGRRKSA